MLITIIIEIMIHKSGDILIDNLNYIREPKIIHTKPIVIQGLILYYDNINNGKIKSIITELQYDDNISN